MSKKVALKFKVEKTPYDKDGNGSHYKTTRIDVMAQIERLWGTEGAMIFCETNAFKYRSRIGNKDNPEQELLKISWYEKASKIYFDKLGTKEEIIIDNRKKTEFNL